MADIEAAKLAAKRGAYWLDTVYPEWTSAIDLAALDLSATTCCIIGQVFGHQEKGYWASGWTGFYDWVVRKGSEEEHDAYRDFIHENGFEVVTGQDGEYEYDYEHLTEAWTELIEERR